MNVQANLPGSRVQSASVALDLAHQAPFQLGKVLVEPAMRSLVAGDGQRLVIQPLAMRVLVALATAAGEIWSREDLIHVCWNQRIVGDDAVHRIISALRRELARASGGSVAIETISKVGYRLQVDAKEHGSKDCPEAVATKSRNPAKHWAMAVLLAAGLISAGLLATTRASADVTAIALVADGESAGEAARFVGGLTGDLARLASAMPSLAFVETGGAQKTEPLLLRVALESGTALPTASVRLVDRKSGAVMWSREFVAEGGTIAELRERIANGITGVFQCGLDRSAAFNDPVGLRLYLGACEGLETGDFARARTFALQITQLRPDAPAGWACLANSTIFDAAKNGSVNRAVLESAQAHADRALAVDPNSGLAHVALAMVSGWRGEPVLAILEKGIRSNPDFAMLHKHYALALSAAGMVSAAVDPALRAVALHPHDPGHHQIAIATLLNAGRTEEALALADKMQRRWRYDRGVAMQRLDVLYYERDPEAALAAFSASPLRDEPGAQIIGEALAWRANPDAYDWPGFDRLGQRIYAANRSAAWELAMAAARMGDKGRALHWLARAPPAAFNDWSLLFAPEATAVRRDPRFFDKMASVGMVAKWQKSGRWPDFCGDPGLAYDCRARANETARLTMGQEEEWWTL